MPRKNLVHAWKPSSAQECRVPELLRITLQVSRILSAVPARLRRVRGGWRLTATPPPSGYDYRLLLVFIPGVVLLLATILDLLETSSRRVFLGTTALSYFMGCFDLILVTLTHLCCEIHSADKIKCIVSTLKQIQKMNVSLKRGLHSTCRRSIEVAILIVYLTWHNLNFVLLSIRKIYKNTNDDSKNHYIIWLHAITVYQHMVTIINQLHGCAISKHSYQNPALSEKKCGNAVYNEDELARAWSCICSGCTVRIKKDNNSTKTSTHMYSTMRSLGQYYETICDMVMQINKHTEAYFFFLFMLKFYKTLTTLYNLMRSLDDIENLLIHCNWCIYNLINMLVIIEPCHWTQDQMDHTHGLLIHHLSHQTRQADDRITKELNIFIMQVQLRGAAFSPLGVFNISRPLIVVILSIVATYLALLVQEQKKTELQ